MEKIKKYFVEEKGTSDAVANALLKSISKYEDIKKEFSLWIDTRCLDFEYPLKIEGYTAKQISEIATDLDVSGVYNFMVTLRENSEKAKNYIKNGFPRK